MQTVTPFFNHVSRSGKPRRLFSLLFLASLSVATAQTAPATSSPAVPPKTDETVELDVFTVTAAADDGYKATNIISGTRFNTALIDIPKSIDVVTDKFIQDVGATDITQALRYNASVTQATAEGAESLTPQIYIRGYQAFTTFVNGFSSFGIIDPLFTERIEIIKGPSSIFAGAVEPGGAMNVITKQPTKLKGGSVAVRYGSFDRFRGEATYNTPLNAPKSLTARAALAYEDQGSPYDFAHRKRIVTGLSLRWAPSAKTSMTLENMFTDNDIVPADPVVYIDPTLKFIVRDIPRSFNRMGPESFSQTRQWQGVYALNHKFNDHWSLRFGVYGRNQHVQRLWIDSASTVLAFTGSGDTLVRTAARAGSYDPERNSYSFIPQLQIVGQFNYFGINHKFITGYEYNYAKNWSRVFTKAMARIDIDRPQPDSVYSYGDLSTFALNSKTESWAKSTGVPVTNIFSMFNNRLTLMQGWRFATVTNDSRNLRTGVSSAQFNQNAITESYGASFRIVPKKLTAYASYSESFVPQSGVGFDGNIFEPILGSGWDYGVKFDLFSGRVSGSIGGYSIERDKALVPDPAHGTFFIQEGKTKTDGAEAALLMRPTDPWQITFSYAYTDALIVRTSTAALSGLRPANIPTNQGSMWNRYQFKKGPLKGLGLGVGVMRVGQRRGNDTQPDIPGLQLWQYTRWDASITYDTKLFGQRATLGLFGNNLTDETYVDLYRYYAPPRTIEGQIRFVF